MDPYSRIKEGREQLAKGDFAEAKRIADELLGGFPNNDAVLFFAANVAATARSLSQAAAFLSQAVQLAPQHAHYHRALADAQAALGDRAAAHASLLRAVERADDLDTMKGCARYLISLEDHERALSVYEKVLARSPNDADLNLQIAMLHSHLGNREKAKAFAERAFTLNPSMTKAVWLRSHLHRAREDDNYVDDIERLLANGELQDEDRARCCFALARENEGLGKFNTAFAALQEGARLQRRTLDYDVSTEVSRMRRIREFYDAEFFATRHGGYETENTPVFVIGMPCSGAALLQRVLAAHPDVTAAGERNEFGTSLVRLSRRVMAEQQMQGGRVIDASVYVDFAQLGQAYIEGVSFYAGSTPCFIDALTYNFLYAGIIDVALPGARIVHAVRDPMDACCDMYRTLFERGYPFSYDLDELADYYIAYRQLMDHWDTVLPGRIHAVRHEDILNDRDATLRSLVEHCGLKWHDECLAVDIGDATAGQWKKYAEQLEPLKKKLDEAGVLAYS